MRWTVPISGSRRVVRRFLWRPRVIGHEGRWLEWAWIEQVYEDRGDHGRWFTVRFVQEGKARRDEGTKARRATP